MARTRAQFKLDMRSQKPQGIYKNTSNSLTGASASVADAWDSQKGNGKALPNKYFQDLLRKFDISERLVPELNSRYKAVRFWAEKFRRKSLPSYHK
ncbi:TPA: hypothetical protein ACH3X1_003738 [Trebouxia sp. C0004]